MRIFDLLTSLNPGISASKAKVHLATWNGEDDPLDVYLAGHFEEWQRWQTRRNFERDLVISLISLAGPDRWLFAGVFQSKGATWHPEADLHYYDLIEDSSCRELNGRLVANFSRPGRQPYLNAESWTESITLAEIYPERLSIGEFPGFKAVNLTRDELGTVISNSLDSWRSSLSNVAGVYLISATESGRLYVGSASGEGGIWQRWREYAENGHGGNAELKRLLAEEGQDRARHFRFSILEIADLHASQEDILARESHWKEVLLSRQSGLNEN